MGTDVARSAAQRSPLRGSLRRGRWIFLLLLVILFGIAVNYVRFDLRSYALLTRFADPSASGRFLRFETHDVTTEDVTIPTPSGPLRARLFLPAGVAHPQGVVAVHGIHHLGMDEPRLMSFARAVAGTGLAVLTPRRRARSSSDVVRPFRDDECHALRPSLEDVRRRPAERGAHAVVRSA